MRKHKNKEIQLISKRKTAKKAKKTNLLSGVFWFENQWNILNSIK